MTNTREQNAADLASEMNVITILGHEFRRMTDQDFEGLAGAEDGSWICELEETVLVWTPAMAADGTRLERDTTHGIMSEVYSNGEKQRDWTAQEVL